MSASVQSRKACCGTLLTGGMWAPTMAERSQARTSRASRVDGLASAVRHGGMGGSGASPGRRGYWRRGRGALGGCCWEPVEEGTMADYINESSNDTLD